MTRADCPHTDVFNGQDIYGQRRAPVWRPAPTDPSEPPDIVVPFGSSVQGAIDQAIRTDTATDTDTDKRCIIDIDAGFFEGPIVIPPEAPPITLRGAGAGQTILAASIDAQMPGLEYRARFGPQIATFDALAQAHFAKVIARQTIGTYNTAVVSIARDDVEMTGVTIRNDYQCDRASAAPKDAQCDAAGRFAQGQHQAVALMVDGADRVQIADCAISSFQDTLYLRAHRAKLSRVAIDRCDIQGDVDFIFGGATAHFSNCEIRTRGMRGAKNWVVAPSTSLHMPYGFVLQDCAFSHDGAEAGQNGRSFLGRQWFEGVRASPYGATARCKISDTNGAETNSPGTITRATLESVGKCTVLNASLGKHLNPAQLWTVWGGPEGAARFRPVQFGPSDFLDLLGPWLKTQSLDYSKIEGGPAWLVHA